DRQVSTYSIVARDPSTGEIGVAVHSHWFQVGHVVAWAQAGVGAVATQALTNASYGPEGLTLLAGGTTPTEAIERLVQGDTEGARRQVAMVDSQGRTAAWTGKKCIHAAGHQTGNGFSVQANMMASPEVWPAMARAFEKTKGPLAERMIAALAAAEGAGGDIRGRQSAALIVVPAVATDNPWEDRLVDLEVADHADPIGELSRLLNIRRAYDAFDRAGTAIEKGDFDSAKGAMMEVRRRLPKRTELCFWYALALFEAGQKETALSIFRPLLRKEVRWRKALGRLPAADLLSAEDVAFIRAQVSKKGNAQ
ncbi:MAG: DUF1028 domain-containing protein, partial [Myxococcales bacterium]|nr:DUF1028 domain-containing protein [Myxococcales bacterium]